MNRSVNKTIVLIASAICLCIPLAQSPAFGGDFRSEGVKLKAIPNVPEVPSYTGKVRFISGMGYPKASGGSSYAYIFEAKEQPPVVAEWYNEGLIGGKWNIDKSSNQALIKAQKKGNSCTVSIHKTPTGTEVTVITRTVSSADVGGTEPDSK